MGKTYRGAGVDIGAGGRAVALMRGAVEASHGPEVLGGFGGFGGLFDAGVLKGMGAPVLVASTDGVGTKTRLATALGRFETVGVDLVNHCVNDILVQGARPLFFLDYIATDKLKPEMIAAVVGGVARGCGGVGCALLGGECAEMPGVYAPGEFDLVGTIVGAVERGRIVDGGHIVPGDVVIGLASSGLHTNGYAFARHLTEGLALDAYVEALGASPAEALMVPHRAYLNDVEALQAAGVEIRGMAHITGGGLVNNPPRILRPGLNMVLDTGAWPVPPLFRWLQALGEVAEEEMRRVFNLGLGMLVVVPPQHADLALTITQSWSVGHIALGQGEPHVIFIG